MLTTQQRDHPSDSAAAVVAHVRDLIDRGNSVVVIEHNIQLVEAADYVIDLGPEGGDLGGELVGAGTPEEIAANPRSITGHYLRHVAGSVTREQIA